MERPDIATSDWHLGGGDYADDSNPDVIINMVDHWVDAEQPGRIIICGDTLERWQFRLKSIVNSKKVLLATLNSILKPLKPEIYIIKGNHDGNESETFDFFKEFLPDLLVYDCQWELYLNNWWFLHGHQWDGINSGGVKQSFAHSVTWIAGIIERIIPGINETKLDPTSWVSPAHNLNASIRGDIGKEIIDESNKTGKKICYGHTHEIDLSRDMKVANTGCCLSRANYVTFYPETVILTEF